MNVLRAAGLCLALAGLLGPTSAGAQGLIFRPEPAVPGPVNPKPVVPKPTRVVPRTEPASGLRGTPTPEAAMTTIWLCPKGGLHRSATSSSHSRAYQARA